MRLVLSKQGAGPGKLQSGFRIVLFDAYPKVQMNGWPESCVWCSVHIGSRENN